MTATYETLHFDMPFPDVQKKVRRFLWSFIGISVDLPRAMTFDDCEQVALEAFLNLRRKDKFMPVNGASFLTYAKPYMKGRIVDEIHKNRIGPGQSVSYRRRKRGAPSQQHGEVSFSDIAPDSDPCEFLRDAFTLDPHDRAEDEDKAYSYTQEQVSQVFAAAQYLADSGDKYITIRSERKQFHVQVSFLGHDKYLGLYGRIDDAREAKKKFAWALVACVMANF